MKKALLLIAALVAVNLAQAQWETDVRLTIYPSTSLNCPHYSIASSGDSIHVVWADDRDGNNEIYYKRSIDGGLTWGGDIRLTTQTDNRGNAAITLSGSVVHVKWDDYRDGDTEAYYKRSADGGNTWGEDIRITNAPGYTFGSSIAASGSSVHMVTNDKREGWWNIYYHRSMDGGLTWEPDLRLTDDPSSSLNPTFCVSGSFIYVVWDDYRDANKEIYYKRSTDNGITWEEDTRITDDPSYSYLPCVGASGSDVYIVWVDDRDGNKEIYFNHSTDGGVTWGEDYRLTNNSGKSDFPNIAVSGTCIFVVWNDNSYGNMEIYYKCSIDKGNSWESDIQLTEDPGESKYPCLSTSGSQINVVWNDDRDGNYEIYYKRDPTGVIPVGFDGNLIANSDLMFSVYPNPASSIIRIQFNETPVGISLLTIRNILGETVIKKQIKTYESVVGVSTLPSGLYFIEIATKQRQVECQKLLILK